MFARELAITHLASIFFRFGHGKRDLTSDPSCFVATDDSFGDEGPSADRPVFFDVWSWECHDGLARVAVDDVQDVLRRNTDINGSSTKATS